MWPHSDAFVYLQKMRDLRRLVPLSVILFAIKSTNTILATAWTFLLAYTLVRLVGLDDYALLASILAVAALVLQFDLGISVRLFGQIRVAFLAHKQVDNGALGSAVVFTFWCYCGIAVGATAVFGAVLWHNALGNPAQRLSYLLLFLGAVLPLPWMPLRAGLNACNGFLFTELTDMVRRLLLLLLTVALAAGMPLLMYAIAFPLLWIGSLLVLWFKARWVLGGFSITRWATGFEVLRADLTTLGASAALSLAEFLIYIHPYYVIAHIASNAAAVVAFDMFYKVTRFGVMAYLTITESLLPQQTRAFHTDDAAAVRRGLLLAFLIGSVPASAAVAILLTFGHELFSTLLGRSNVVSSSERALIAVMLVLMLVQTVCGGLLAAIGCLAPLARRACTTIGAMLLSACIAIIFQLSFEYFLTSYVAIYACEALSYGLVMRRILRAMPASVGVTRALRSY